MKSIRHLVPLTALLLGPGCWDDGGYGHHHHHHPPCDHGDLGVPGQDGGAPDLGGPPRQDLGSPPSADLTPGLPDLNGISPDTYLWAKQYGATGHDSAYGVAADAAGNVIIVGSFSGTVNFGNGALSATGASDIFVVKLGGDGSFKWAQRFGGTGVDQAYAVAVDASGNIVVAGTFQSALTIGDTSLTSAGGFDVLAFKLSPRGTALWARSYGGPLDDAASSVALDPSGNALLTGYFNSTANFGAANLVSAGGANVFLAKCDTAGTPVWARGFGGTSNDVGNRVAVDSAGNVVLVGQFSSPSVSFGVGSSLVNPGTVQGFLAKYAASGASLWSRSLGGTAAQVATGVTVDSGGSIAVVGDFQATADFGGGAVNAIGPEDAFLARYDATGAYVWAQDIGGVAAVRATSVAASVDGSLVLAGTTNGNLSVGTIALAGAGVYTAKFNADGSARWARTFADTNDSDGLGVAVDPGESVLLVGDFAGAVNLGGGPLSAAGDYDAFLLKLTP